MSTPAQCRQRLTALKRRSGMRSEPIDEAAPPELHGRACPNAPCRTPPGRPLRRHLACPGRQPALPQRVPAFPLRLGAERHCRSCQCILRFK